MSTLSERNLTQETNVRENRWIVSSQICTASRGTAIFGALKEELIRDRTIVGLQNRKLSEKFQLDPNLTLENATNLARQKETKKQQQNILDGGFKTTPAQVDGIAKGKSRRKKGNSKDNSQDKSKEKPSEISKEKRPSDQKRQRCLGNFHPKKTCPARLSKCNKCSKIGHCAQGRLVKVRNQEYYLKLLKKKNPSSWEKS